ncbi:MAG: ParA family protein, partial [Hyphomicrobium sp.]
GGVGKSTSCAALAGALCRRGAPVHIIDLDQTRKLHRWYSRFHPNMPNFHVEAVEEANFMGHIRNIYQTHKGFILVDVAGSFAKAMIQASTIAHLTISPAKLSEPDIVEAVKLSRELADLSNAIGKPIPHRLLINEVSPLFPTYQRAAIADIARSGMQRFDTMLTERAAYAEIFMSGNPPHYADQSRDPVRKAVVELDMLAREVCDLLFPAQHKEAA